MKNRNAKKGSPGTASSGGFRSELSSKNVTLRLVLMSALIAFAAGAFVYAAGSLGYQKGWQVITIQSGTERGVSDEFVFMYDLGKEGRSPKKEAKLLQPLYTELISKAYRLFYEAVAPDPETPGISYLNAHPNEWVTVDPALYRVLKQIQEEGSGRLFLGPVYEVYYNLFFGTGDAETQSLDPMEREDLREMFLRVIEYRQKGEVSLDFADGSQICLKASEDYLDYLKSVRSGTLLGLGPMRNAVTLDYLAEGIREQGYLRGYLYSMDGFSRDLGGAEDVFSVNLYHREGDRAYYAGKLDYSGSSSLAVLKDYPLNSDVDIYYSDLGDRGIRHLFLDPDTGLPCSALDTLVMTSKTASCTELMLKALPVFTAEKPIEEALKAAAAEGMASIRFDGFTILTEGNPVLSEIYNDGEICFSLAD